MSPAFLAAFLKVSLVHQRRAGGNDNPVDAELSNVVLYERLSRVRTHELVISCDHDARRAGDEFADFIHVHGSGDVEPAMTNINPNAWVPILVHLSPPSMRLVLRSGLSRG